MNAYSGMTLCTPLERFYTCEVHEPGCEWQRKSAGQNGNFQHSACTTGCSGSAEFQNRSPDPELSALNRTMQCKGSRNNNVGCYNEASLNGVFGGNASKEYVQDCRDFMHD